MPLRAAQAMMITRCPQCRTAFRISEAQLGARKGQVRCGRCDTVFDALLTLRVESSAAARDSEVRSPDPAAIIWPELPEIAPAPPEIPEVLPVATPPVAHVARVPAKEAAAAAPPEPPAPSAEPLRAERSPRRGPWLAGSALLAFILLGQAAFYFRGEISLLFPEAKPVIAELCYRLGCEVPLPRRAEWMSIESSDLQADPSSPGVMVLSATLRNRGAFPQPPPALELTLTDAQDRPLARRVLLAPDYLGAHTAFAANSELPVRIYLDASAVKATGYRLYLFHP